MSGPLTIPDFADRVKAEDATASKRAGESLRYRFDFDDYLAEGVELASAGTLTLDPSDGRLTKDSASLITGNRAVDVTLIGGKPEKTYGVDLAVVTNETPSQTLQKRFFLHIRP